MGDVKASNFACGSFDNNTSLIWLWICCGTLITYIVKLTLKS